VNRDPEYSPDGRQIAFDSTRGGLVSAVWVMNANGSAPKRLTDPVLQAGAPHWSPDGTHILFHINTELPGSDVWVTDPRGRDQHALTNLPAERNAFNGRYSPDGRRIVLVTDLLASDTCCDAYFMNPDGSNLHVIAHRHLDVVSVDWGAKATP
jgi:TolB protein